MCLYQQIPIHFGNGQTGNIGGGAGGAGGGAGGAGGGAGGVQSVGFVEVFSKTFMPTLGTRHL